MLSQEPERPPDSALKQEINKWAGKFVQLRTALLATRGEIDRMLKVAPPELRQEIGHLGKRQGELERRFFEMEGRLLNMAARYGYPIPGLSGEDNPVTLLGSAIKLYWDADAHIKRVAEYKARIGGGGIAPGLKQPAGWGTLLLVALGAYLLIKKAL